MSIEPIFEPGQALEDDPIVNTRPGINPTLPLIVPNTARFFDAPA